MEVLIKQKLFRLINSVIVRGKAEGELVIVRGKAEDKSVTVLGKAEDKLVTQELTCIQL